MTPDSSALVAAFAPWHEHHEPARRALRGVDDLIAHAELEAYSVLTRLPAPFRAAPAIVAAYLARRHPGARLGLSDEARRELVSALAGWEVSGGRVYDALIATTAVHHDEPLITCDRRATGIYERVGAQISLIA